MKTTTQQIENPPVYDAAYFIAKFEAIPEEKWITGEFSGDGGCCARGHCGESYDKETPESEALCELAQNHLGFFAVAYINDGRVSKWREEEHRKSIESYFALKTPRQRVLAWLRDAQKAGL